MFDLLQGLCVAGHDVTLVCSAVPHRFPAGEISFPVETWETFLGRWSSFRSAQALQTLFRETNAEVLHVHGTGLPFAAHRFINAAQAPLVFTPYTATETAGEVRGLNRVAQRIVALTEFSRQGLVAKTKAPRAKLRIVPPGLNLAWYPPRPPETAGRLTVVGTVGPFAPERGQAVFLQAARQLLDSGRKAEFLIAGDGPTEHALRRACAELDMTKHVTFVTRLPNFRTAIAGLDIFVRPAIRGGMSYTVLEAMALGKAVIATSSGEAPEMVQDGKTGVLVPKADADALAQAIGRLLDAPEQAREMGLAARRAVEERFGVDRLIEETLAVYDEAIAEFKKNGARP
jgi:glycosyltransferase involved in cell wall biosynthesis